MLKRFLKICLLIAICPSPSFSFQANSSTLITNNPKEIIDQVWQIIYRDFLDYSGKYKAEDWIKLRKEILSTKYFDNDEAYIAIKDMLTELDDPYTRFLDPKEFNEMRIDTTGELMGVGIQISLDEVTNQIVVVSPIEGTPAFLAGIKPKDIIVSIDGKPIDGLSIDSTVKLIRGKKGTKVELGIIRDEELLNISLIRDRIEINVVDSRINNTVSGAKIGYVRLKQFNAKSPKEMSLSINKLEKQKPFGYVLDLRSNPGGLLEASIEIARQWINTGIIVSTKTKDGITSLQMDIKITGITFEIMEKALDQAKEGRVHILNEMNKTIKSSRKEVGKHTPKMETIKVDKKDIATVIGKGGATIREIVEKSGAKVDVKDTGEVTVAAANEETRKIAVQMINDLVAKPEMGKTYKGKVVKIMEFGAFVNFLGKQDGLVHISQLAPKRVQKVTDVVKEGDEVSVKVIGFDRGKVKLSIKEAV